MTSSVSDSAAVTASQMPLMSSHLGSSKIALQLLERLAAHLDLDRVVVEVAARHARVDLHDHVDAVGAYRDARDSQGSLPPR